MSVERDAWTEASEETRDLMTRIACDVLFGVPFEFDVPVPIVRSFVGYGPTAQEQDGNPTDDSLL